MVEDLISVVVAIYNVEKYLNKCIESIVNQTYQNLEIILVDDGSTDVSPIICDEWAKKDNRIKVIHKENGGLSDARNLGIALSTAKWIGFIDGDDYIKPEMYEQLYVNRIEGGMTVCGYLVKKDSKVSPCQCINTILTPQETMNLYLDNEIEALSCGESTYLGSYAWNKLYDIELFQGVQYPVGKKYEDMYVILKLIHSSRAIKFIPGCYYVYIQHGSSITHSTKCIVHDSFYARQSQIEYIREELGITDQRMETLMICEYFKILYFYSCQSRKERKKSKGIAQESIEILKQYNLSYLSVSMRLKLFLFAYFPGLIYWLRQVIRR